ncbi:MAG: hypothetical protein P4M11_00320 [Candidatus Pacebacteria bacterium]|nr:hypothetical protein [Candidatus Paceibacterota bacterium]
MKDYYIAPGCAGCEGTGITGRLGLFELLSINDPIRIAVEGKASSYALAEIARQCGMQSMVADGLMKASEGIIAIDDILSLL